MKKDIDKGSVDDAVAEISTFNAADAVAHDVIDPMANLLASWLADKLRSGHVLACSDAAESQSIKVANRDGHELTLRYYVRAP